MRLARKRLRLRALRKSSELKVVRNQTRRIQPNDILLICTLRNDQVRLPYFLEYYRKQGVNHFLFVDNDSTDGSREYLSEQKDVSLWHTNKSYSRARFGVDWMNYLCRKYAHDHWVLTVDTDEFLLYPFCDTRPLRALTDWLDASSVRSFSTMLLDMYPKGPIEAHPYQAGQDPFEISTWFDPGNYTIKPNVTYGNLWIQGGPRARAFFSNRPEKAPALNKIPLVKWHRRYAYVSSTHMLLPRGLNLVYDESGGEKTSGVLLHAKFLDTFNAKAREEALRSEHYASAVEYRAYTSEPGSTDLWCKWSERFINWRQLEVLGLMSKGNWA